MAWIVLSGTPSRYRFVASPRRNACQPCHASPACLSAGRMTNRASCARSSDVPVCDLKIKPVSGFPDAALWRARYFRQGRYDGHWSLALRALRFICLAAKYGFRSSSTPDNCNSRWICALFHVEQERELAFAFMGIHWVPLPNARRGEGESGPRLAQPAKKKGRPEGAKALQDFFVELR